MTRTIGTGRSEEDLAFTDAALVRLRTTRPPNAVSSDVGAVFCFALSFFAVADILEKKLGECTKADIALGINAACALDSRNKS